MNESEIIARVRAGDARAYTLLVDRCRDRAFTLAVRLLGNREEAEEVVQDAFVNAYRSLDRFREEARFSTWLHRIVYNLCMTRVARRRARARPLDEGRPEEQRPDTQDTGVDLHAETETAELVRIVEEEILGLSEKLKTPLLLFYMEEMKYEEIAETIGIPVGTVKTYLFRGRMLLRERLNIRLKEEVAIP